jgi:transglutaminase-like putative cysteine protease
MSDALKHKPVSSVLMFWLATLLAVSVIPHLWNLPLWITGYFYAVTGLTLMLWRTTGPTPVRWLKLPLLLVAIVLVITQVGYTEGRLFGVSLLVVMLGLKLLEMKTRRDLYITIFLGYFLLITLFLFNKSIWLTLYVILLTGGYTAALYLANQVGDEIAPLRVSKKVSLMLAGALPIMLILFVLFPRLEGPLWRLNLGRGAGVTGMSDNIDMGSISRLSQSYETAFRINFGDQALPPAKSRYSRGMLLWETDGKHWQRGSSRPQPVEPAIALEDTLNYEIIMEPSGQNWLFPLDRVLDAPANTSLNKDGELSTARSIDLRLSIQASSSLRVWDSELGKLDRQRGLKLPDAFSPRMRQLVNQWRTRDGSDESVIQQSLEYFNQQPFIYTLLPPLLGEHPVDEFLFETRKGFCEHYATSFVILMRLAGIPARVVIGYQGGELNPMGGHLVIRQSDAHAWAEVWLEDQGWVRIDPTAAVAPERIERSIIPSTGTEGSPVVFDLDETGMLQSLWRNAGWFKDNLELQWHHWVIGFNRSRQSSLLKDMGLGFMTQYQMAMAAIGGTLMISGLIFLVLMYGKRKQPDPVVAAYSRFRRKLEKAGMEIPHWMGPQDLTHAATARFPKQAGEIQAITSQYISLRYGRNYNPRVAQSLRRRIRFFRVTG